MRKYSAVFILLFLYQAIYGQKKIQGFGEINPSDFLLKSCPFDSGASAMKLFDIQEVTFDPSETRIKIRTERHVRIQIFNERGYSYATIKIPYISKKRVTKFKVLRGAVYNMDNSGKITIQQLNEDDFMKQNVVNGLGIINFTFPRLQPGSIIEFAYTKIEKNIVDVDTWMIKDQIPTAFTSVKLVTPGFITVKEKIIGEDSVSRTLSQKGRGMFEEDTHVYVAENIKGFQPEPFMSSYTDNLSRGFFFLQPDDFFINALTSATLGWRFIGGQLMRSPLFGQQIRKNIPGTEAIIDSAKKISKISERVSYVYSAVKKHMANKTEQAAYPENELAEAWKDGFGNSAEINLILHNLLGKAGVVSYPLLISTRDHGKIMTDFPSPSQFNGVDVLVTDSNSVYILDASLKYQSYKSPPFNILNRNVYLVDSNADNMQWVSVTDERELLKQSINEFLRLHEDGNLEGFASVMQFDYSKARELDSIANDDNDERKLIDTKTPGLRITSFYQEQTDDDDLPLHQHFEFTYSPQNTNDFYFVNPQFILGRRTNPFMSEVRNTDIDFGCNQQTVLTLQIDFPLNFQPDYLPKNITVRAPDSAFFFQRICSSDSSHVFITQIFEIKRPIFEKEEYPGIREFFNRIYPLMTEEIVLKKKK